jgi:cytoplasmic iron level regulating protein YaaA (DUF328/UPF0246 family)
VLILLPPSEGKTPGRGRTPLDLAKLGHPGLRPAREAVLGALVDLCAGDPAVALATLGLPAGLAGEVSRNAGLRSVPAASASRVYTGVLYEALDLETLPAAAKRQLTRSALVFSALWGAVRLDDRIPAYRCAVGVNLPGIGPLASWWRRALAPVLDDAAGDRLVLDLRSGAYQPMWVPPRRVASVRVLHERDGRRTVVSHFNKATKGRIVRDLALAGATPRTVPALADALRDLKHTVEVDGPRLDVIVTEL